MKTRGIILAAGRGSRMGSETLSKPKCFNKLASKKMLDWQLNSFKKANVKNICVITGYRSEMIFGSFKTIKNKRWSDTNMVSSLFCASKFNGNSIVSYSDIVFKNEYVKKLENSQDDIVILADKCWEELWKLRFNNPLDDAETFKSHENNLIEIGKKTNDITNIEAQYMGLLKFSSKGWNLMYNLYKSYKDEERDKMDMTSMLNKLLENNVNVKIIFVRGGWCEADTHNDILVYENELKKQNNWKFDWR